MSDEPHRPRVVVVVSDLHAGSTRGILPPGLVTAEGNPVDQSATQKTLWAYWLDFAAWVNRIVGDSPHAIVFNGDMVEGIHHGTKQIITNNLDDHVEAAFCTMSTLTTDAAKVFLVLGTECHTHGTEFYLGDRLAAEKDPDSGRRAFARLTLDVNGCVVRFTHHTSTSTRPWLRGNKLGAHLRSAQLEAFDADMPVPKVAVASHCHTYDEYRTTAGLCLTTPSWQVQTRHVHKVAPNAVCHLGGVVLDWRGCGAGELPDVHRWTRSYTTCDKPVVL